MTLTKERKGEIADLLFEDVLRKDLMRIISTNELNRKIGEYAKKLGIPKEELREYLKEKATKLFKEMFEEKPTKK